MIVINTRKPKKRCIAANNNERHTMKNDISLTTSRLRQQNKMLKRKENTHQLLICILSVALSLSLFGLMYFASTNYHHEKVLLKYYQKYGDIETLDMQFTPSEIPA